MNAQKISLILSLVVLTWVSPGWSAEVVLGPDLKIPPHYKPGRSACSPGRGYSFSADAPNYPSTYPKLNLRVFNGDVIGVVFEVPAKEGWKPWYDQAEGKPTAHDGSHEHYTQTIYIKKDPRQRNANCLMDPTEKKIEKQPSKESILWLNIFSGS